MKPQEEPEKATQEKLFTDAIEAMEFVYDWLDSGKSFEELAIEVDIGVAAGALREGTDEFLRLAFELITIVREEGADRNQVMTYLGERRKGTV